MKERKTKLCQLPTPGSIAGRSSSITNAFFNAIIPIHEPKDEEVRKALAILGMTPETKCCAYCGGKWTEWDHLNALINEQKPTGFITEIANLVPACGKCNQSKGKKKWHKWIVSSARLSPATQGVENLEDKIARLHAYEAWGKPLKFEFSEIVGDKLWTEHTTNWKTVLDLLKTSQSLAKEIHQAIKKHVDSTAAESTAGADPAGGGQRKDSVSGVIVEEGFERL